MDVARQLQYSMLGSVKKRQGEGAGPFLGSFDLIRARLYSCQVQFGKFLEILWQSLKRVRSGEERGLRQI